MIRNIIWDWNGTLLDDAQLCADLVNEGRLSLGLPEMPLEQQRKAYAIPIEKYYSNIGMTANQFKKIAPTFLENHTARLGSTALRASVLETLNFARQHGMRQFVLSSHLHSLIESALSLKQIREYFTAVYGLPAGCSGQSKVELGRDLIDIYSLKPHETVIVGDSLHDYHVAQELGINCVLIAGGHQCEEVLRGSSAPVMNSVTEFLASIQ